jgi:hypothetical protein
MLRWRHERERVPARLARRTAATCLGAEATRLETAGHRRRSGSHRWSCQPMAQTGTGAGSRGVATPSRSWPPAAAHSRAAHPTTGAPRPRTGGIWLPWPGLDRPPRGTRDVAHRSRITYHPSHVSRLLHGVRHSVQRPVERASQRDEAAIRAWWRDRWPALKKR